MVLEGLFGKKADSACLTVVDNAKLDDMQREEQHFLGTDVLVGRKPFMEGSAGTTHVESMGFLEVGLETRFLYVLGRTERTDKLLFEVLTTNMSLVVFPSLEGFITEFARKGLGRVHVDFSHMAVVLALGFELLIAELAGEVGSFSSVGRGSRHFFIRL